MTTTQKPTLPAPVVAELADKKPAAKTLKEPKTVKTPKAPKPVKPATKAAPTVADKVEKKKTPAANAPKVAKVKAASVKTAPAPAKKVATATAAAKTAAKLEAKPKKPKLVRDSFTIPKPEYLVLDELKLRALQLQHPIKKGELLRAGIKALASMADDAFLVAVQAVPTIKTGRPAKD